MYESVAVLFNMSEPVAVILVTLILLAVFTFCFIRWH
jgi:hypothetical protein